MRLPLAFLLLLPVCAQLRAADPLPQGEKPPKEALLRDVFQAQFGKEQLAQFEPHPTPGQLVQRMSPEQRQGARARLGELELAAKTPEDLKEIARGYLILDEHAPNAGDGAIRVAVKLRELEPEKSDGFTLAASGFQQMGDYPAAAQWAREALKRNPDDETAKAVFMLSAGRTRRGGPDARGVPPERGPKADGFDQGVPDSGASPEALDLMREAVVARRAGDMDKTFQLAAAAMRADPASKGVQEFYRSVEEDRSKHGETPEYLRRSREALDAGRGDEAVMWAQKAAERSRHPTVYKILEATKRHAANLPQSAPSNGSGTSKAPANGGFPLWPVGTGLGLLGIGYGIYRGGRHSSEEMEDSVQKSGFFSDPLGTVSDIASRAKIFVEDHPYASLGVGLGALVLAAGLAGPSLLAGGGGSFMSGGGAATLAPAAATSVAVPAGGVGLAQAGPAVAAGSLLLMAGDSKDATKTDKGQTKQPSVDDRKDRIDVEEIFEDPNLLSGKSPQEADAIIERSSNWKVEALGRGDHKGQGWALREYDAAGRKTGRLIRWHPGGGHHGPNPYWKVSSPKGGVSPGIR